MDYPFGCRERNIQKSGAELVMCRRAADGPLTFPFSASSISLFVEMLRCGGDRAVGPRLSFLVAEFHQAGGFRPARHGQIALAAMGELRWANFHPLC